MTPQKLKRYQRKARLWIFNHSPRGFLIYRGPSKMPGLTGDAPEVIALVSLYSENEKLGRNTFQTWHLIADAHPLEARRGGCGDAGICGDCVFRAKPGQKVGACYPDGRGIVSLYRSYQAGNYPHISELAKHLKLSELDALAVLGSLSGSVRLGAYGDPVSMPYDIGEALTRHSPEHQGFCHQWQRMGETPWRGLLMASCELPGQLAQAAALGWRTYTAYPPELTERQARQAIANASGRLVVAGCPATKEKGMLANCETCPIQCNGGSAKWHVINKAHGASSAMGRYNALGFAPLWMEAIR